MNGRVPQPLQRRPMELGAIPLMLSQPVAWVARIQALHVGIALGLRQNGGAGNAQATRIAFDEGSLRNIELRKFKSKVG